MRKKEVKVMKMKNPVLVSYNVVGKLMICSCKGIFRLLIEMLRFILILWGHLIRGFSRNIRWILK